MSRRRLATGSTSLPVAGLRRPKGDKVIHGTATSAHRATLDSRNRIGDRRRLCVPGRLTWRDTKGALRFVSVMTRDVSEVDAFVECQMPASIPLYRLVHFQVERNGHDCPELPAVLQRGKVLSAVYRVGPYRASTGTPQGYALRLLIEPARRAAAPAAAACAAAV
jgi:hypothetical protein